MFNECGNCGAHNAPSAKTCRKCEADGTDGTRPLPAQAIDHGAGWILAAGILEALRRRSTVGGSWLVRTSLFQVRTFLGALGATDDLDVADPGDAVEDLRSEIDGPGGRVGHVRLPGSIDGAAFGWARSGPDAGIDDAVWSPR